MPYIEQDVKLVIDDSGVVEFEQLQQAIVQLFNPEIGDLSETVLLFFAGHNLEEGFIAASDTKSNSQNAISFQWLAGLLQKSPISQHIIWMDACFSSNFLEQTTVGFSKPDRSSYFITSARGHEEALGQGLLTQSLLEALDYSKQSKDTPWVNSDTLIHLLAEMLVDFKDASGGLPSTEQKIAKRIFIELTQLGEGTLDTSRQLLKQDLVALLSCESNVVEQVIEKLVAENLLTTDGKV